MSFPVFESVYDWVAGFGRTKSVSYRLWNGARKLATYLPIQIEGVSTKQLKKRFKGAVKRLREMR